MTEDYIDGGTTNNGLFGWGQTIAVTPAGTYWFVAGTGSVGSGEYLQFSTGGRFSIPVDPTGEDTYGLPGSDVSVSSNTVAFKTGSNTDIVLGYIILP